MAGTASGGDADRAARERRRLLWCIHAAGFFALSTVVMKGVAAALWCVALGIAPALMGVVLAARSFLPLFLSIQGGALIDRFGVRRTLISLAAVNAVLPLLYPLLPWVGALLGLELLSGLVTAFGWIAAQTALARAAQGDSGEAARFSFAANMGNLAGPFLLGVSWDLFGAWGGFAAISAWSLALLAVALRLPRGHLRRHDPRAGRGALVLDFASYYRAFALLRRRAVATVIFITFVRIASYSIQASFYAVALVYVGQSETSIGILVGVAGLSSGLATLAGGLAGRFPARWLLFASTALAVTSISLTPLLTGFGVLFAAALAFGVGMGICMPLLLSQLSAAVPPTRQGLGVGLRSTANRLASLVIPLVLGAVIQVAGIERGFLLIGAALIALLAVWLVLQPRATPGPSADQRS